jgi:eukaryotic-like serine/threonine-protein kinase
MILAIGTQLGPYLILSEIRAGGMGEVYRARDTRLGREVAIKVLPAAYSQDADWQRRFELEARAASKLNHPNILVIYDVGTHNGSPYLVSELLEGETLRKRLADARLDVITAIGYALQIVRGLASVHEKGIIHRDLKPDNLFITKHGRVKILDFGLAKLRPLTSESVDRQQAPTHIETLSGVLMGTIGYMSPEQVRIEEVDHRTDIFSFGAILYEMLAHRPAFLRATATETNAAILNDEPPALVELNPKVSAELALVVRHCLEKKQEERFQSADDLAFNLELVSTRRDSSPSTSPTVLWNKWPFFLAALALLAVGIIGGSLLGRRNDPAPSLSFQRLTFRHGFVQAARFLDKDIVYSAEWDGKPCALYRAHPESTEHRPTEIKNDACLLAISRREVLAILQSPIVEGLARYRVGTVARVALTGGEPVTDLSNVRFADWSPDEALAADKKLAVIHEVGKKRRIEFPIGHSLYESDNDLYNLRFSPKGNLIAFFERTDTQEGKFSVKVVDLNGNTRTINHGWYDWWGLAWSPEGDEVVFSASEAGTGSAIYAMDLEGHKRLVFRAPGTLEVQDVSSDGRVLVLRTDLRQFLAFQQQGHETDRDLSWLDQSRPADLSADGKLVVIGEHGEGGKKTGLVYLRKTDGSSLPQELGEGYAVAFSPDGKWVLANLPVSHQLQLLPTGEHSPKKPPFKLDSLACNWANWFSNSEKVLLSCRSGSHYGLYILDTTSGEVRATTGEKENVSLVNYGNALSPDQRHVAAVVSVDADHEELMIYDIKAAEPPKPIAAAKPGDRPIQWSDDGRFLYLFRRSKDNSPAVVNRIEVATGRVVKTKELSLHDPVGAWIGLVRMTPDGQSYCYSYSQTLSDVYILDGLKFGSGWWR